MSFLTSSMIRQMNARGENQVSPCDLQEASQRMLQSPPEGCIQSYHEWIGQLHGTQQHKHRSYDI